MKHIFKVEILASFKFPLNAMTKTYLVGALSAYAAGNKAMQQAKDDCTEEDAKFEIIKLELIPGTFIP